MNNGNQGLPKPNLKIDKIHILYLRVIPETFITKKNDVLLNNDKYFKRDQKKHQLIVHSVKKH